MKGKIIIPLLMASVTGTAVVLNNQNASAYAAVSTTNLIGSAISVDGFNGSGEIGKPVTLPNATVVNDAGDAISQVITTRVFDPRGRELKASEITGNQFTPAFKGYYTVKYETTAAGAIQTATEELQIYVKGDDYSITLPTNSNYVIPSIIPQNTEVSIPLPTVKLGSKELEQDQIITNDATKGLKVYVIDKSGNGENSPLEFNESDKCFKFTASNLGVYEIVYKFYNETVQDYKTERFTVKSATDYDISKVKLGFKYDSAKPTSFTLGQEVTLPGVTVFDKEDGNSEIAAFVEVKVNHIATNGTKTAMTVENFKFTPTLKGEYEITYQAKLPLFGLESTTNTFLVKDVKDNVAPGVLVVNHYEVNDNGEVTRVYKDVDGDDKFDATKGDIELYNSSNPEIIALTEDERKEALNLALGNLDYNIPGAIALKDDGTGVKTATVSLPAIYGTDNFDKFSQIKFTRSVKSPKGTVTVLNKTVDGKQVNYESNEAAKYTFTVAGEYTIRYSAVDEAGNEKMTSYSVNVVADESELKEDKDSSKAFIKPEITFQALSSYVKKDGKLTFNKPTATDAYDPRVEIHVYYAFQTDYSDKVEIVKTNSDGKMELDLSKISIPSNSTEFYVLVTAKNDYATSESRVERTVKLINNLDKTAPKLVNPQNFMANLKTANEDVIAAGTDTNQNINNAGYIYPTKEDDNGNIVADTSKAQDVAAFNQKDMVTLPTVTFTDAEDANLQLSVVVRDPYGKTVNVKNSVFDKDPSTKQFTISSGKFVADYNGVYTITYTAKDAGGNASVKTYGIRVQDTEKPTINLSSFDPFNNSVEVGKEIEIPHANIKDNGVIVPNITTDVPYEKRDTANPKAGTYWTLKNSNNALVKPGYSFTPLAAGEYVIVYTGWDIAGNLTESQEHIVVAKDTIKPTIVLESDYKMRDSYEYTDGMSIKAPSVSEIYDGIRDEENPDNNFDQTSKSDISLSVKVYDETGELVGNTPTDEYAYGVTEKDEDGNITNVDNDAPIVTRYYFTPKSQGVYTVKYTAIDGSGNETTLELKVNIGDVEKPEVKWADEKNDLITKINVNETYELAASKILLTDDYSDETYLYNNMTIALYNPSGKKVDSSIDNSNKENKKDAIYKWKFEDAGTYELRITVTDKSGKTTTKTYNIVSSAKDAKTSVVTPVVGTILIVAAVLVLAGVVAYFVISGRKAKNGGKKSTKRNKKK